MKKLFFLSLFLGIVSLNSCKSDSSNPVTSSIVTNSSSVPSNEKILFTLNVPDTEILGKLKVSDNEYHIYFQRSGKVYYTPYRILRLDNGVWLLNDPGSYNRIIE
jgi:hypothetical protein